MSCLAVVSTATAGESTYDQLRSQQLDGRRVELGEFVLRRDVFTLRLDGEMHFLAKAGGGKYRIHGTVSQQGVSDSFVSLVPVYVDFGNKGRAVLFGRLPFRGSASRDLDTTVEIPGKPKAVVLNAHYDVLALD